VHHAEVSNAIRYDSLLVRALAAELNGMLAGSRLAAAFLDRDQLRVTLRTRAARRSRPAPPSLVWQLHPQSGHLTAAGADTVAGGQLQLATPSTITTVSAPSDERLILLDLDAGDAAAGVARRIVIELITNQWNAVAVGADDRIIAVLRERATKDRQLRAGVAYRPPPASERIGMHGPVEPAVWLEALAHLPPGERQRAVLRFAWTGPVNAQHILGDAAVSDSKTSLLRALDRYTALVHDSTPAAFVVRSGDGWQPYPAAVGDAAEPAPTLVAAFAIVAERAAAMPTAEDATDAALSAVAGRIESLQRRSGRLTEELSGATAEAAVMRHHAHVLLAQLQRVGRGAREIELDDFAGGTVRLELDPALSGAENATRLYDLARKRDRAAERIPRLLDDAAAELHRLEALIGRIRAGALPAGELARLAGKRARGSGRGEPPALPYREYRTSGGLEVRVGRGSKANDDLTFRHSSPTDIWLHARDVAGAHVILRWPNAAANPAASDIAEAAVLAALHSRARTSGLVAVDWTRRKYVRKPRRAGPGLVIPERVRTVFVEPDEGLDERLRVDEILSS
jgi:predicted ribosome quality control (RQC) complex YloA/Tae2 family protein